MLAGVISLGLTAYGAVLAWFHARGGVQTDEAKYLLNIAYPHPPLVRSVLGATAAWPSQELFWRVVFALVLVQATWIFWRMTKNRRLSARLAVCGAWLLSPSILLQGGTIMLGPVAALCGVVFLWLLDHQRRGGLIAPEIAGLLWAAALLSSYQGVLFLPLALAAAGRSCGPLWRKAAAVVLPVLLLTLVTLANPLTVATMIIHGDEGARITLAEHASGTLRLWLVAGGGVVSVLGTLGIFLSRRWELIAAFALTGLYVFLSAPFPFYAILFLPLFAEGIRMLVMRYHQMSPELLILLCAGMFAGWLWLKPWRQLPQEMSLARTVMQEFAKQQPAGVIAIAGSFGHQWQYESPLPVARYRPGQLDGVGAVVCLNECEEPGQGWEAILQRPEVRAWVR